MGNLHQKIHVQYMYMTFSNSNYTSTMTVTCTCTHTVHVKITFTCNLFSKDSSLSLLEPIEALVYLYIKDTCTSQPYQSIHKYTSPATFVPTYYNSTCTICTCTCSLNYKFHSTASVF